MIARIIAFAVVSVFTWVISWVLADRTRRGESATDILEMLLQRLDRLMDSFDKGGLWSRVADRLADILLDEDDDDDDDEGEEPGRG